MKFLFLAILGVLLLASAATYLAAPDTFSPVPVISWVTDKNPAREKQVDTFEQWLVDNGLTDGAKKDGDPRPGAKLVLDLANRDETKQIMQGVSGVGGDVMDLGGASLGYFHAIGLVRDVTDSAKKLGYGPDQTWPAIVPDLTQGGRQYLFPCNVSVNLFWVNKSTFAKYGQPVPPRRWTLAEFERRGKQFVAAANAGNPRERVFFCSDVDPILLARGMGLGRFNETGTACVMDDPRYARSLQYLHDWTFRDRLLPSGADLASFDTQQGYAGPVLQLFNRGNVAMFPLGRWALIQLRQFGDLELSVSEPPYAEMPVTSMGTRAAGVYVGSAHPEWAERFQQYLASEPYNMQIVEAADALPPNPKYAKTEAFLRPPGHKNEWGIHEVFAETAYTIALPDDRSPFVLDADAWRIITEWRDKVMNNRATYAEAARETGYQINQAIARSIAADPAMRAEYDRRMAIQKQIDALRAAKQRVPLSMIDNPFYRKWYQFKGWAKEEIVPK